MRAIVTLAPKLDVRTFPNDLLNLKKCDLIHPPILVARAFYPSSSQARQLLRGRLIIPYFPGSAAEAKLPQMLTFTMPGISGLDVTRAMRQEQPSLPVIVMTAFGSIETALEAIHEGAYDYVSKPMNLDELKKIIFRL